MCQNFKTNGEKNRQKASKQRNISFEAVHIIHQGLLLTSSFLRLIHAL